MSTMMLVAPVTAYGSTYKVQKQPYNIGGQQVSLESIVHDGKTYVELRKLADLTGLHINYIPDTAGGDLNRVMINEAISFRGHNIMIIYNVDRGNGFTYDYYNAHDEIMPINEVPGVKKLKTMPIKENGKYYLPIREIADIYKFKIDYVNGKVVLKNNEGLIVTEREREFLRDMMHSIDDYVKCECGVFGYWDGISHYTTGGFLADDSGVTRGDFIYGSSNYTNLLCYMVGVSSGACGSGDGSQINIKHNGSKLLRDKFNKFEKEQGGLVTDTTRNCVNNLESIIKEVEKNQATPMEERYSKDFWEEIEKYNDLSVKLNSIFKDPQGGLALYDCAGLKAHLKILFG